MLRIRLHGRGGQGIKTASQILGTAGFLSGYQAQDFPLYGAERRGAPIVAYTRLAPEVILERGPVARPDLILVGDETLLQDPLATPMAGADTATELFINSSHTPKDLQEHFSLPSRPAALDLTDLGLRYIHQGQVLSTALAAAGARLSQWVNLDLLIAAVKIELGELGIAGGKLAQNLDLVREVYQRVPPGRGLASGKEPEEAGLIASSLVQLEQEAVTSAAPLILAQGNMALKKTGNWRMHRPVIQMDKCNGCWICFVRCPEGGIQINDEVQPVIDYDHCKGCMICATECPTHAIDTVREVMSWV